MLVLKFNDDSMPLTGLIRRKSSWHSFHLENLTAYGHINNFHNIGIVAYSQKLKSYGKLIVKMDLFDRL